MAVFFIVMGQCETGEHVRFCETDFSNAQKAQEWIEDHADNYPESRLYVYPYDDYLDDPEDDDYSDDEC
jgi:hypothetical protein